ncbi:hypothetical protein [Actinomadura roseirufa]|uniref:hypothetical protein n=1 Tax=Actinomadura roseirufa TaxID=2094049 RepID=UPI0010413E5B|nr:hypothetical protein [Actinomadura roseirufa]
MPGRHAASEPPRAPSRAPSRRGRRSLRIALLIPPVAVILTIAAVALGLLLGRRGPDEDAAARTARGTAGGRSAGGSATAPSPSDSSPPVPSPSRTSRSAAEIAAARAALQEWLRGLGDSDASICDRLATEEFVQSRFGSLDGCHEHVRNAARHNSAEEMRALRTATVTGGTVDERGRYVVPFADLRWTSGRMTVATTEAQHTLDWDGDSWVLS